VVEHGTCMLIMNNGTNNIDHVTSTNGEEKKILKELRETVLEYLKQKQKYYDSIDINFKDPYYTVTVFKERFDDEIISQNSVFNIETLQNRRSGRLIIESSISESVDRIRHDLEQKIKINNNMYYINMTCGNARCKSCGTSVSVDMNNIMSFPKQYTEMSHITTQPSSWENLLDIIDEKAYPTLQFYLIGKLQEKCDHK
jgi:hypothetical protein